eukprot:365938-Chlamydomonas_euryale.AAC.4
MKHYAQPSAAIKTYAQLPAAVKTNAQPPALMKAFTHLQRHESRRRCRLVKQLRQRLDGVSNLVWSASVKHGGVNSVGQSVTAGGGRRVAARHLAWCTPAWPGMAQHGMAWHHQCQCGSV